MKRKTPLHKPVIVLAIDTLMSYPLEVVAQTGKAPALQFLMENGQFIPNMVTSFPTMSVTIDSSLLTGTYADQHRVPGLNWYDNTQKNVVSYGTGFRESLRLGMKRVINNMLKRLNNEDLSKDVSTIYEELAKLGIPSASINSFVYRGHTSQQLRIPHPFRFLSPFRDGKWRTNTPAIFSLGTFSKLRRWGFATNIAAGNNKYATHELRHLIKNDKLPSFTFCMLHDLDFRIHFKGPMDLKGLVKVDRQIQKLLNTYPSWDEALKRNVWMVLGDNGHAPMGSNYRKFVIDLRKVLKSFRIARLQGVRKKDELVFCVNQRMAYIYLLKKELSFSAIVERLQQDSRIDLIAWKDEEYINVVSGMKQGSLRFAKGEAYADMYEQMWTIEGETELLDLRFSKEGVIFYGNYPDALARLYGALHSHSGRFIVVNAKPGCEFKAQSTPFHLAGAAHGSLHRQESLVPLIIAGTNETPTYSRMIDLKQFILNLIAPESTA